MAELLSIIVPCYNEEQRITQSVEEILAYLADYKGDWEVLFVDDGSSDKTLERLENLTAGKDGIKILINEVNLGKGGSVKRGLLAAAGDFRVFLDADLSYPVSQVAEFIKPLQAGECDLVIGSRRLPGTETSEGHTLARKIASGAFHFLVRLLFGLKVKDTQSGFKCFKGEIVQNILERMTVSGFAFDVELLLIAKTQGYRVSEMPTQFLKKGISTLRLFTDGPAMFAELLKIKINDLKGRYRQVGD